MKIFKIIQNGLIASILLVGQKAAGAPIMPSDNIPVAYGMPSNINKTPSFEVFLDKFPVFLQLVAFVAVILSGIIFPIIGYCWYIKRGGKKIWLKYLAYAPLLIVIVSILIAIIFLFSNN